MHILGSLRAEKAVDRVTFLGTTGRSEASLTLPSGATCVHDAPSPLVGVFPEGIGLALLAGELELYTWPLRLTGRSAEHSRLGIYLKTTANW